MEALFAMNAIVFSLFGGFGMQFDDILKVMGQKQRRGIIVELGFIDNNALIADLVERDLTQELALKQMFYMNR